MSCDLRTNLTNGIRPHAVTQAGTNTYIYDANGNMTSGAGRTIAYNYDNMPKSISKSGITATFVYDYAGQRIKKTVSSVTTVYIGKLYECTSGVCTKYIFGGSNRIASKKSSTVYYYHTDHLGSSSIITNSSGSKVEEIYYYPYGGTRLNQGSVNVKHKFTGQEEDAETGLYNYGARYYDPILGRFISADTIVPLPFHPQTFNRYAYAYNNPVVLRDLDGHEPGYYWDTWDWLYGYNNSQPNNYVEINTTQYNTSDSYSLFNFSWTSSSSNSYYNPNSSSSYYSNDYYWNNSVSGNSSMFNSQVNNNDVFFDNQVWDKPTSAESVAGDIRYNYDSYYEIWSGGSHAWRNNNPGNLYAGDFASTHGSIGRAGDFAIFPNYQIGYDALTSRLQTPPYTKWTLSKAIEVYAPPCCNNTAAYIGFVSNMTGINSDTKLGALNSLQVNSLANSIKQIEGYSIGTIIRYSYTEP